MADRLLKELPKLLGAATGVRRDAWFASVKGRCMDFLRTFNYAAFQR